MCLRVYIGSERPLRLIQYSESNPQFNISECNGKERNGLEEILNLPWIYEAGTFMGCGCGFHVYEEEDPDLDLRLRDHQSLKKFLLENLKENVIRLFMTWWDEYEYKTMDFSIAGDEEILEFEENVIYTIKHRIKT